MFTQCFHYKMQKPVFSQTVALEQTPDKLVVVWKTFY